MKVYIDYLFIQNLIIDYILLKETSFMARIEVNNKRLLIASIIAATYVVILIFFKIEELNYLISKICLAFITIYICFKPEKIETYIKLLALFILVSSINIGVLSIISNLMGVKDMAIITEILFYILSFSITKFVINKLWKIYKTEIKNKSLIYDVKFKIGKNEYKYKGFLDTGNNVYSYVRNIPIIFAEKSIDLNFENDIKTLDTAEIETITLSKRALKKAYIIENIEISKGDYKCKTKVGIVFENTKFSKKGDYNMILNYSLYAEKMGGIEI